MSSRLALTLQLSVIGASRVFGLEISCQNLAENAAHSLLPFHSNSTKSMCRTSSFMTWLHNYWPLITPWHLNAPHVICSEEPTQKCLSCLSLLIGVSLYIYISLFSAYYLSVIADADSPFSVINWWCGFSLSLDFNVPMHIRISITTHHLTSVLAPSMNRAKSIATSSP